MSVDVGAVSADVYVGGKILPAARDVVRKPARTSEVVGQVALGTAAHVDAAVAEAVGAAPSWAGMRASDRADSLEAAAAVLTPRIDRLAELLTREQGKTLWEARADVAGAVSVLRHYAGLSRALDTDDVFRADERGAVWRGRRPIGVAGVIVPWNSPAYLGFLAIGPALAGGNTVVVKPSELAPLALSEMASAVADCLPSGVLSVVPGAGEPGAALAAHPTVRKILFTGSTETGRSIMKAAAGTLKNLSLELGGNDPALVLESATISDDLVTELMLGTFAISGQVCFSVKRIYVHRSHWAALVGKFCDAVDRLVVGNGLDPSVSMGPLNNRRQYERVRGLLADAESRGGELRALGRKADEASWSEGYFLLPHVVTGLPDSAPLIAEEQFGPAVPIIAFDRDDEAVAAANGTEFGLAASVWSDDDAHALAVARRLHCGTVFRNVHRAGASDMTMPFGGFKQSGIGRMHGLAALEACTESQIVANYKDVTHLPRPPWAGD